MKKRGRKAGKKLAGYWFRSGRGWYVGSAPLLGPDGRQLKDPKTPVATLRAAYDASVLARQAEAIEAAKPPGTTTTVEECCRAFLDSIEHMASYKNRRLYLFDFATGFPGRFIDKEDRPAKDKLHGGFGDRPVESIIPLEIEQWLRLHKGWGPGGARRSAIQALKRCFYYGIEAGLLTKHPMIKFKAGQSKERVTYLNDEQEAALLMHSNMYFRLAITVCIRTGVRPGCEFAKLERRHVEETPKGMVWRFPREETKSRKKERVVFIPEDIAKIVREEMKKHRRKYIFRNADDGQWTWAALKKQFQRVRRRIDKLRKAGKTTADLTGLSIYSCRHTFAKRTLGGYWTGKPVTIEILALLMGNTRDVCWRHYAKWCPQYQDPAWDAITIAS
jgi:integrase